jgi:long-chain fatty acid transport protein
MKTLFRAATLAVAALAPVGTPAFATDGYFSYGFGARQKALGGAGVADGRDATSTSLNPAGIVNSPQEASIAATLFSPPREVSLSNDLGNPLTSLGPAGTYESHSDYFPVPNLAVTYRDIGLPFADVIGISVYGNGGMNTNYPAGSFIFGSPGKVGVDLQQALLSIAFAKVLAPGLSIGVAPTISRQQIKLYGLGNFSASPPGPGSIDPGNFSNEGVEVSWGAGVRAGIEWSIVPGVRVGVAGNSRIYQQEFVRYRGLFAEQGDFDIPASLQAGVAIDLTKDLTVLADYKHIWYSQIASITNPSTNFLLGNQFGANNGPGFGWDDIDIIKLGVEWRAAPAFTLRAGYSYNTSPLNPRDVSFNIIAPATVQQHFTGGLEYRWSDAVSLEFAGAYAPEESVEGASLFDPNDRVRLTMEQWEVTAGLKYRFGETAAPLK